LTVKNTVWLVTLLSTFAVAVILSVATPLHPISRHTQARYRLGPIV
jgi:hypothetical protein